MKINDYLRPISSYFFGQFDKRFYGRVYGFLREFEKRKEEIEHLRIRRRVDLTVNNICNLATGASVVSTILVNPLFVIGAILSEGLIRRAFRKDSKVYKDVVLAAREIEIENLRKNYESEDSKLEDLFNN